MAEDKHGLPTNPVERARALYEDGMQRNAAFHDFLKKNLRFGLDLEQYSDDRGNTKRGNRVQPRDSGLLRLWQHSMGLVFQKAPIHIKCDPHDEFADEELASDLRGVMEWELENPQKRFRDVRRRYVGGALGAAAWGAAWDFYPDRGPFGEIYGRSVEPWNMGWAEGFLHPHDPLNPHLWEVARVPIEQVMETGWDNLADLKPDDGFLVGSGQGSVADSAGNMYAGDQGESSPRAGQGTDRLVTLLKIHYRDDPEKKARKGGDYRELTEGERYMACKGLRGQGCGYQGAAQSQIDSREMVIRYGAPGLPGSASGECPDCGGNLKRVDAEDRSQETLLYPDGRLMIAAPFSVHDKPLYYDQWQVKCRSFPYLWLVASPVPHKTIGQCTTSALWTATVAKNSLVRLSYETLKRSRPYFGMPKAGIEDVNGEPFQFRDEQGDVFYWSTQFQAVKPDVVQGQGVHQSVFQMIEHLDGQIERNKSSSDVSFTQEQTKDIPVGTLEQIIESGNVSLNDFISVLYEEEGIFLGVLADYIAATYTIERLNRLKGPDGSFIYKRLHGKSLPAMDVTVSSGPSATTIKQDRAEAFQALLAIPAPYRKVFAKINGIDSNVLRDLDEAEQEAKALAIQEQEQAFARDQGMKQRAGVVPPQPQQAPQQKPVPLQAAATPLNGGR